MPAFSLCFHTGTTSNFKGEQLRDEGAEKQEIATIIVPELFQGLTENHHIMHLPIFPSQNCENYLI